MKVKLTSGKRRTAIARAVTYPGKGRIWINSRPIEIYEPELMRMKLFEPLLLAGDKIRDTMDIKVKIKGGGIVSQNIIEALKGMMHVEPPFFNPGDPLNHEAGEQYFRAQKKFESKAKSWTTKYAMD